MPNKKFLQGKYKLINPTKYVGDKANIIFRSSWELKFMNWADKNKSVLKWGSELYPIPYFSEVDAKVRRYFADFWVLFRNQNGQEEKLIIEVKPYKETVPPVQPKRKTKKSQGRFISETIIYQRNQDKWKAARIHAKKHGMEFITMDEYQLGVAKRKKR